MADPAPRIALPGTATGPVQVLGSLFPNKDAGPPAVEVVMVGINKTVDTITKVTGIANSPALTPGGVYEFSIGPIALGGETAMLKIRFGDTTTPVGGDFAANPAVDVAVAEWCWNVANETRFTFVALQGQKICVVKTHAAFTTPNVIFLMIRRLY